MKDVDSCHRHLRRALELAAAKKALPFPKMEAGDTVQYLWFASRWTIFAPLRADPRYKALVKTYKK